MIYTIYRYYVCLDRKGPPASKLSSDFNSQRGLHDRIMRRVVATAYTIATGSSAGAVTSTLCSAVSEGPFVAAVVAVEDLDFSSWLTRVYPARRHFISGHSIGSGLGSTGTTGTGIGTGN